MDAHLPSKAQEEWEEEEPRSPLEFQDLISTLSLEKDSLPGAGGNGISELYLRGIMTAQQHLKARPTDLLVATPIKSGTTWLKALTFATVTRSIYPLSQHPLLNKNPHECFHFMEGIISHGQWSEIDALPPPRLLATHAPYTLLPASVASSGCRVIYLCRDPKDTLVSLWHFLPKVIPGMELVSFSKAFELFCSGAYTYGPIWDHFLGYWNESLRRPERVLFLKYEEMMEEPVANLKRLAEFLACPFSEEEEKQGVVEEIVRLCSFEKLSGLEVNKTGSFNMAAGSVKHALFFRKGKVGDWVNHLSPDMARELDGITQQKLCGSGLELAGVRSEAPMGGSASLSPPSDP